MRDLRLEHGNEEKSGQAGGLGMRIKSIYTPPCIPPLELGGRYCRGNYVYG